ncbi:copper transporter [Nocardioides sp. zg-1228]|uniref:copper transporter n=1 Tax=Nocardioides sp. zg-1228 TaxID=2763008 RepID=UPI00164343EA|nr:copper transporter [Nocardioides sp. zg-1228]MBC2934728.1 copper transporter [Nocardioides sp. zg-1228]QSF56043.1 copper transporter [Nocardioides sp. zg-1228]
MITLRHHLLTIVAVFLALAAGIVLGGGPLSDVGPTVATAGGDRETTPAEDQAQVDYTESFVSAVGPATVGGRLAERSVALVTVPGADEQLVGALGEQVTAAGGTVSARYDLADDLVDPAQKSLVDTLGSQLLTQQAEGDVAADASTYDRLGQLLGLAVASKDADGQGVNGKARAIADAISGAGLMAEPGEVAERSPLVLLVLGTDAEDDGSDAILAGLAQGLAAQATGVVVVGVTADGGTGQLGRFRADPASAGVASLDGIDTAAGRVATILTLQRSLTAPGGAFGASGADGPVPLG